MSDIELDRSRSTLRFVNPATADISDIELISKCRILRFVNPATADISDIRFFQRCSSYIFNCCTFST